MTTDYQSSRRTPSWLKLPGRNTQSRSQRSRHCLTLEALEDRLAPSVDLDWGFSLGNIYSDRPAGITQDSQDNVIVAGQFRGLVEFGPGVALDTNDLGSTLPDVYVAKYGQGRLTRMYNNVSLASKLPLR